MSFLDAYDLVERDLDDAGNRQFRVALVAGLNGLVVEIGAGTGLMLPHYPRGIRVVATEPGLFSSTFPAAFPYKWISAVRR
jgi:hypothetical protein